MCLPYALTKTIVSFSSALITLLGLICFIVSLAAFNSSEIFAEGDFKDTISVLKYVILVFGLGLIFVGIFGIYGAVKKNLCFLTIYGLITGVFALAFFIIGIVGMTKSLNNSYVTSLAQPLNKIDANNLFYNQSQFVDQTSSILCSQSCQCYLEANTLKAIQDAQTTGNFSNIPNPLNYSSTNNTLPTQVQKCDAYKAVKYTAQQKAFITSQAILETDFTCTGIFQATAYFAFSNINNDADQIGKFPSCAADMEATIKSYGKKIGTVCMLLFAILLLNCIFSICICCHKDYKEDFKNSKKQGYEMGDYRKHNN